MIYITLHDPSACGDYFHVTCELLCIIRWSRCPSEIRHRHFGIARHHRRTHSGNVQFLHRADRAWHSILMHWFPGGWRRFTRNLALGVRLVARWHLLCRRKSLHRPRLLLPTGPRRLRLERHSLCWRWFCNGYSSRIATLARPSTRILREITSIA